MNRLYRWLTRLRNDRNRQQQITAQSQRRFMSVGDNLHVWDSHLGDTEPVEINWDDAPTQDLPAFGLTGQTPVMRQEDE